MNHAAVRSRELLRALFCVGALATSLCAWAQSAEYATHPKEFVRVAVYNEVHAQGDHEHFMWKETETKPKGTTTKLMIETGQGVISRLVLMNGHPLTAQERAQDDGRVQRLLTDPGALRKKQQEQREDEAHEQKLLSSIPDAFNFHFVGLEDGKNGKQVHYTFEPDPNFTPPNHESKVFQGMKGDLFINLDAKRFAKIDGSLFQPVEFGWGILGRLDKGGRFVIEQQCIGGTRWETTHSVLRFNGKAMMIKTINIQEEDTLSDFQRVDNTLTVAQGIDVLKKADDMVAINGGGTGQK